MMVPRYIHYPAQHSAFIADLKTNYEDLQFSLVEFIIEGIFSYKSDDKLQLRLEDLIAGEEIV